MLARAPQIFAIERAIDGILALRTAAYRANIPADSGTEPFCASFRADFAGMIHLRITLSYHRKMARTDLYIKVELDLNEKEKADRLAGEICRLLAKVYGVRSAEVTNMVERDA